MIVPVGSIANTLALFSGGSHPPTAAATEIGIDELEIFNRRPGLQEIKEIFDAGSACKFQPGHRLGVVSTLAPRPPVRHIPFH